MRTFAFGEVARRRGGEVARWRFHPLRASFSYMCAVTVGTDVYSCEVRIHLLTPLGVGNNIHSYIRY